MSQDYCPSDSLLQILTSVRPPTVAALTAARTLREVTCVPAERGLRWQEMAGGVTMWTSACLLRAVKAVSTHPEVSTATVSMVTP